MNRRTFITGLSITPLVSGKHLLADTMPYAISLDGTSGFTHIGNIPGMSQATTILFNYSWKSMSPPYNPQTIIQCGVPSSGLNGMSFIQHITNPDTNGFILEVGMVGNNLGYPNQLTWAAWWDVTNLFDGVWYTTEVSLNTDTNTKVCVINGQVQPLLGSISESGEKFCNFQNKTIIGTSGYTGDLADVTIFAGGTYINANDPDVIAGFFCIERGHAIRKGGNGHSIVYGRTPQIHLSGPTKEVFASNLAASTTSNILNTAPPQIPFTIVGSPTTATSDPFEPGT